jgi:phage terminase small subunit
MTAGKEFRAEVEQAFDPAAASPAARLVLDQLCTLLDEIEVLEGAIAEHGVMVRGARGQLVVNPAVAACRQHRVAVARLAGKLGLEDETPGTRSARRAANARWSK